MFNVNIYSFKKRKMMGGGGWVTYPAIGRCGNVSSEYSQSLACFNGLKNFFFLNVICSLKIFKSIKY